MIRKLATLVAAFVTAFAAHAQPWPAVDHHQHVFSPEMSAMLSTSARPFPTFTGKDVIALLDEAGIRRGVLLSVAYLYASPGRHFDDEEARVRRENDWTAAQAGQYPDRLVAFCGVNPLRDYALREVGRCASDPRFGKGIKLHLGNSDVQLDDPAHVARLRALFRLANERRMALVIHMRANITRKRPYGAEQARAFMDLLPLVPDVTVQVAHLAGTGPGFEDPPAHEVLATLAEAFERRDPRLRNVYMDVASNAHPGNPPEINELLVRRMRQIGMDRILYGTDSSAGGNLTPAQSWKAFSALPLGTEELARIAQNVAPYLRTGKEKP
jgi:predicted TIM-barrel fold metal-dependent hydrolase